MDNKNTRRLAAIMFTDIVGYTALMQQDEKAAAELRALHRKEFEQQHEIYTGEILQYFGDGTLSVFESGVKAVECAIAIQKALKSVPLRIGLHIGDIVFDGTDIYGDGVNLASRIESMGVEGAVLLSATLNEQLKNHQQISTKSLGSFELKNIKDPVEIFAVSNDELKVPDRSELKGKQAEQTKTIAVLPFVNMSSSQENEYFSDGMTEEIINALAKIKELKVTSRTSSFFFKNKNIPIRQIGIELNVSTILEGSIRLAGNKMRLTAQLIDVNEDFHFWSETFDRSMDDIFAVQDEISLLIADKLREHVGHFDIDEHLVEDPQIPVDIYNQYLESRYHILKMSKTGIKKGLSILEDIIEKQPDFALAYLGVHLGYTIIGTLGFIPAMEAFAKGQPYLDKAIALDDSLPESQLNLSYNSFIGKWDFDEAYQHLAKSFEIRPSVEYYQSMTSILVAEGKSKAALNYIETALQLDPFSEINHHLKGFIFYTKEKYEQAIEQYNKSISIKPDAEVSVLEKGQALILLGRFKEALEYFQNFPDRESDNLLKIGGLTMANAALGNIAEAKAGIKELETALQSDAMGRAIILLINCKTILKKHDEALDLIEQAIEYRLPMMVYMYVEPILKPLRSNPRFQSLMRNVIGKETSFNPIERKYKKALFDKKQLVDYRQQLESLMEKDQPFLNPNLTLRDLAKMMDIPPNHLSQLLNEGFDKNFAEFVNTYRLGNFQIKSSRSLSATPYHSSARL